MLNKKCTSCKTIKNLSEFSKNKNAEDGRHVYCKICANSKKLAYRKTKQGVLGQIYNHQTAHSKTRGHLPPEYTKQELKEWLFSQDLFHKLYDNWVDSGYGKMFKPSVDRVDDFCHYTLNNIQLVTFEYNTNKGHSDRKMGTGTQGLRCKQTVQYTLDNVFVATYHSTAEAGRVTGIRHQQIASCCRGRDKTAGGYLWEYS